VIENNKRILGWEKKHNFNQRTYGETFVGWGSQTSFIKNKGTHEFIKKVLNDLKIKSILDAGCGFFHNYMNLIDLSGISYVGVDIFKTAIEKNKKDFPQHSFKILDIVEEKITKYDIIICRDVLFHLNNEDLKKVLLNFSESGSYYLLATYVPKATNMDKYSNQPNFHGYRPVDITTHPFLLNDPIDIHIEGYRNIGVWRLN
jgi:SAM-dependent methyltransferase